MYRTEEMSAFAGAAMLDGTGEDTSRAQFLREAIDGLGDSPKTLPCKYFYDRRGSELFDRICCLEEYYPTRTELAIMREHAAEMAAQFSPGDVLVELGSGSSVKTRLLLDRLPGLAAYAPVDISAGHLARTSDALRRDYPRLCVLPVAADYTQPFAIPVGAGRRIMVYFPGSTIGNFHPADAARFLRQICRLCGPTGGGLLIGVDLRKGPDILHRAYNDREGVTGEFNLNLLRRMNRELGADFELDQWRHEAIYNADAGRIEMHLVSARRQSACVAGRRIAFERGERIWTESSYKYTIPGFTALATEAGFTPQEVWTDPNEWFSVQLFGAG